MNSVMLREKLREPEQQPAGQRELTDEDIRNCRCTIGDKINPLCPTHNRVTASELEQLAKDCAYQIAASWKAGKFRIYGGVIEGMTPIIRSKFAKVQELTRKEGEQNKKRRIARADSWKGYEDGYIDDSAGAATADNALNQYVIDSEDSHHVDRWEKVAFRAGYNAASTAQPTSGKQEALESAEANCDRLAHEKHRKHQEIQQLREQLAATERKYLDMERRNRESERQLAAAQEVSKEWFDKWGAEKSQRVGAERQLAAAQASIVAAAQQPLVDALILAKQSCPLASTHDVIDAALAKIEKP